MANVYGHKQWTINSAGSVTATDRVRLRGIEFIPNAASDDLTIVDKNSEVIWKVTNAIAGGRAGLESIFFGEGQDFEGFNVSSLGSSCIAYVYLM